MGSMGKHKKHKKGKKKREKQYKLGTLPGTLPLFAYTTPDQLPRPLDFSTTDDLTARETVVTETEQKAVRGAILFEANSVVVVKRDHIR